MTTRRASSLLPLLLLLLTSAVCATLAVARLHLPGSEDAKKRPVQGDYMKPDVSPVEILEAKGYRAKEFYFTTKDGYILNIVRGTNPLFNEGKPGGLKGTLPLLFVAGTDISASAYLSNAYGVRPMNFRKLADLARVENGTQLVELLDNDPSVRSLPFLAMNFGYECWFVNRRGVGKSNEKLGHQNRTLAQAIKSIPASLLINGWSLMAGMEAKRPRLGLADAAPSGAKMDKQGHVVKDGQDDGLASFWRDFAQKAVSLDNLPGALANFGEFEKNFIRTFDPDYWNFSLDEQAKYDVPQAIEFVLRKSGKPRVHLTGVSSGGALIMLAAAEQPELARKIAGAVLWAPALNMGSSSDITYLLSLLAPLAEAYSGPIPFVFAARQLVALLQNICATRLAQRTICARLVDILFGYSGQQTHITQANIAAFIQPMAAHELFHLGQFAHTRVPCKFNFSTRAENKRRYNRPEAPCYDLGKIELDHISIYQGNTDGLVSYSDLQVTLSQMRVPVDVHHIDEPGIYFNHGGSLFHDDCGRLAIAPSLLDMFRAERDIQRDSSSSSPLVSKSIDREAERTRKAKSGKKFASKFQRPKLRRKEHKSPRARPLMSKSFTTRPGNLVTDFFRR